MRAEKTFLGNTPIRFAIYAFYSKITTFSDFKKSQEFFSKNPLIFLKKPWILNYLRILTISVHSTTNLLQVDEKNFDIQTHEQPMLARLGRVQLANIG